MALTTTEKQALAELKQQGYSLQEALGFIASARLGTGSSKVERDLKEAQPDSALNDVGEDIATGAKGVISDIRQRGENVSEALGAQFRNEQTPLETIAQVGGNLIAAPFDIAARGATTVAKLFVPQSTEDKIRKATQKLLEKTGLPEFMAGLSPRARRDLEAGIDIGGALLGGAAGKGGINAALKISKEAKQTAKQNLVKSAKELEKIGVDKIGEEGIAKTLELGVSPEEIMQRVARISKGKQAAFEKMTKEGVGEYLVNRGIFGAPAEITEQLWKRMRASKRRLDVALKKVDATVRDKNIKAALDMLLEREKSIGVQSPITERVKELVRKHKAGGLTLAETNEVKRLLEANVKLPYQQEIKTAKAEAATRVDSALRDLIETKAAEYGIKSVKELNKETQAARQLADALGEEYAGIKGNNAIGLTDWLILAEATGNPAAVGAFFGKKLAGSRRVMSAVAKLMSKNREPRGLPRVPARPVKEKGLEDFIVRRKETPQQR